MTGVSAISPLGLDAETTWRALLEGRSGVGPITQFDTEGFTSKIAAEVKDFDAEQWTDFKTIKKTDRFAHFAIAGTRMAIDDAGIELQDDDDPEDEIEAFREFLEDLSPEDFEG